MNTENSISSVDLLEEITFVIYLMDFIDDIGDVKDMSNQHLKSLRSRFKIELLPHKSGNHSGSCLNQSYTCNKCYIESLEETARIIINSNK